jgi:hypothetical protein
MDTKGASCTFTRRGFLTNALPAGTMLCLGCPALSALGIAQANAQAPSPKHKFAEDSKMSFEEVFNVAYKDGSIPLLKALANDVGKEKFIEMLKKATAQVVDEATKKQAEKLPKRDLAAFLAEVKADSYFWKHVLTFGFVEDTEKAAEIKVTECLWAKTFREADAADIGYATLCYGDYAAAPAFNPKMKMIRTKTLMQGHDCCNHRWVMEG